MVLDGLFVNHVTGKIIVAAARPGRASLLEIAMFLFFLMVVLGTATVGKAEPRRPSSGIPVALSAETRLLTLFLFLGLLVVPRSHRPGPLAEIAVAAAGTMTMLGMDVARVLLRSSPRSSHARSISGPPLYR